MEHPSNKIAKNTTFLYLRMLLTMVVSFYTSRVVLETLGVNDFGTYNVVGGFVGMFSIISGSLSASISRFLTFELGKGNREKLRRIFCSSMTIQLGLSLLLILLIESIGVWFLNSKMNIPHNRMNAANWVFQFSALTFVINLISVPYNAAIIAHEKMSAFAYVSILEVTLKLLIVYALSISPTDKLIFYALLLMIVSIVIRLVYGYYCKKHFTECHYQFTFDTGLLKEMTSFAGWNFIGSSSAILRSQGVNVVINIFCGPAVNAARGISVQVNNAVHGFMKNFMTALNPQITKSYATGDFKYMKSLIYAGAKFSFFLLLLLSLPLLIETNTILKLWLNNIPQHTTLFVQLILIFGMEESMSEPLVTAMLATGDIKKYQIIVGGIQTLNFPISYILLKIGFMPESTIVIAITLGQCCLAARLFLLRKMILMPAIEFLKEVYFKIAMVSSLSIIFPLVLHNIMKEGYTRFFLIIAVSFLSTLFFVYSIGCKKNERIFINRKILSLINKNR